MTENVQTIQELDITPKKIRAKTGNFKITISNREERSNEYSLSAEDPDEMCTYNFDKNTITVEPGATINVTLTVSFKGTLPAVIPKTCHFTVQATKTTGEVETVKGQLERPTLLPVWALVASGLAIIAVIATVIALAGGGDSTETLIDGDGNGTEVTPPTTTPTTPPTTTPTTPSTTTPTTPTTTTVILTMALNGSGSVTPAVGEHEYSEGEVVNIIATAADGWQFDSWTGAVANSNSANTTVTMDANNTVTANFSEALPTIPNLNGWWEIRGTITKAEGECSGDVGYSYHSEIEITQIGENITFSNIQGRPENKMTGKITLVDGVWIVTVSGSWPDEGGITTNEHRLEVLDPSNLSGLEMWSWEKGSTICPNGESDVTMTRITEVPPAIPNLSGVWHLEVFDIDSTCGPESSWSSTVTIAQDGDSLETTGIKDTTFIVIGSVVGDEVTIGPGDFPEGNGTTTATYIMTIRSNTLMEGREEWTWTDGEYDCDDGTATIRATRIS